MSYLLTSYLLIGCMLLLLACSKKKNTGPDDVLSGNIKQTTETVNRITYRIFTDVNTTAFKGILAMGSGKWKDINEPVMLVQKAGTAEVAIYKVR